MMYHSNVSFGFLLFPALGSFVADMQSTNVAITDLRARGQSLQDELDRIRINFQNLYGQSGCEGSCQTAIMVNSNLINMEADYGAVCKNIIIHCT